MFETNRAFMYGESVFTTLRLLDGRPQDWEDHLERLRKGTEFLYGPFIETEWPLDFRNRLEEVLAPIAGDKVVRLTIYRDQVRGLLRTGLISLHDLRVHVSSSPLDPSRFENKALKLRTCPATKRPYWWPSFLKAGNYLDTILCQKLYLKPQDDDLLFLSSEDTVLESSVANIFVVKQDKLFTAPLGPNVLDGVMRKKVISLALEYFSDFEESETSMEQLLRSDAVFGSNSIRGLFLVDRIDDYEITYSQDFLKKFSGLKQKVLHESKRN
jgi:4-amino-4-deoxychorismate lyase